jgi:hypothetical protein
MESAVSLRWSFGGGGGAEAPQMQSVLFFFSVMASPVGLELMVSSMTGEGVGVAVGAAVSEAIVLERDKRVHGSWEVSTDIYGRYRANVKYQAVQGN